MKVVILILIFLCVEILDFSEVDGDGFMMRGVTGKNTYTTNDEPDEDPEGQEKLAVAFRSSRDKSMIQD